MRKRTGTGMRCIPPEEFANVTFPLIKGYHEAKRQCKRILWKSTEKLRKRLKAKQRDRRAKTPMQDTHE